MCLLRQHIWKIGIDTEKISMAPAKGWHAKSWSVSIFWSASVLPCSSRAPEGDGSPVAAFPGVLCRISQKKEKNIGRWAPVTKGKQLIQRPVLRSRIWGERGNFRFNPGFSRLRQRFTSYIAVVTLCWTANLLRSMLTSEDRITTCQHPDHRKKNSHRYYRIRTWTKFLSLQ